MADHPPTVSVRMLADRLHLVGAVAEMRWREWGDEPGREELSWWMEVTAAEAGQRGLPVTWVAVDEGGEAAGAVGLGEWSVTRIGAIMNSKDRCPECGGCGPVPPVGCTCAGNTHTCTPVICTVCGGTGR